MIRRFGLGLMICLLFPFGTNALAQQQPDVPIVGVSEDVLTIFGTAGNTRIGDDTPFYLGLAASPNGSHIAYTAFPTSESFETALMLLPTDVSAPPVSIASEVLGEFAPAFDMNSQFLYYVRPGAMLESADSPMQLTAEVMQVDLFQPEAGPTLITEFVYQGGCGGGSPYPMDAAYSMESGLNGIGLTFAPTPLGIVHSLGCNGVGLGLTDPETGETTELSADFARGSLSADRTQIAGTRVVFADSGILSELVIIDLTDGATINTLTENMPEQVHWGADGRLYYTTRTLTENSYDLTDDQSARFEEVVGLPAADLPSYEIALNRYNIITGESEPVYTASGAWAIGQIDTTFNALYFSQIPDATPWLEVLLADGFNLDTEEAFAQSDEATLPDVYRVGADGQAALLLEDVQMFAVAAN